ncbi:MAG TPA: hypothetical protein VET27_15445 [Mycobacterium sp.]|nr:hypothetical protein [Mycobacterium sp.]
MSDDGDIAKIRERIHVEIVAAWVANRENDGMSPQALRGRSEAVRVRLTHTEEEVLSQQTSLQALSTRPSQVRKAELSGLRGRELDKVVKRARKA